MTEIFKNIIKVMKKIILALMMIVGIVSGAQAQTELYRKLWCIYPDGCNGLS